MFRYIKYFFLTIALVTTGSVAYAAKGMDNDAMSITNARIPLGRAVAIAEEYVHGKATRAEYEHSKPGWVYDVEVISGTRVFDIKVDADQGTVIASAEDKTDHDDEHDRED